MRRVVGTEYLRLEQPNDESAEPIDREKQNVRRRFLADGEVAAFAQDVDGVDVDGASVVEIAHDNQAEVLLPRADVPNKYKRFWPVSDALVVPDA